MPPLRLRPLVGTVLFACVACGGEDTTDPTIVDEAAILTRVAAFRTEGFTRVTTDPAVSQHMGQSVHVWVDDGALAAYRAIDPEDASASSDPFDEGTILVKEQLDNAGEVAVLTVMAKVQAGYNPDVGDWWFAQTNPEGVVNGTFSGKVGFCIGCHTPEAATDYVFGVPETNK